jgi:hypothetical protein
VALFRIRVVLDGGTLRVRNFVRSSEVDPLAISEVQSVATSTPFTRAIGFGQLRLRLADGRVVALVATTGKGPDTIEALIQALTRLNERIEDKAEHSRFPTRR